MPYAEPDSPWPFLPNWAQPYRETWDFKTDVITSRAGKEQRRALRNTPRKSIEYSATLKQTELQALNRYLDMRQAQITVAPDLPRFVTLAADFPATSLTATLQTTRPWVRAGDIVVLVEGSLVDVRKVQSVSGSAVTFTAVGRSNFTTACKMHPGVPAFVSDQITVPRITNMVAQANIRLDSAPGYVPLITPPAILQNLIRNGQARGTVAGGALPTNWAVTAPGGLTPTVVGRGFENGVGYVDVRLVGVATGSVWRMRTDGTTQIVAVAGQVWTAGAHVAHVGGNISNISDVQIRVEERDNAGNVLANTGATFMPLGRNLTRRTATRTLTSVSTTRTMATFAVNFSIGASVDVTLRFGGVSLERAASSPRYLPMPAVIGGPSDIYDGRELFLLRPNWSQGVDMSFEREIDRVDFGRGRIERYTPVAFGSRVRRATYLRRNEDDASIVTDLFMRCKGRRGEFYMPTWEPDLQPVADVTLGSTTLLVAGTDTATTYADSTVFKAIALITNDGNIYCERVASIVTAAGNSQLNLIEPWEDSILLSDIRMVCWLPLWRFASDQLGLEWLTSAVVQTQLTFQTLEWQAAE